MSRLDALEAKVAALWPPLKKLNLTDCRDSGGVVTAIVNGSTSSTALDWDTHPFPNGTAGQHILNNNLTQGQITTGGILRTANPGDFRTLTMPLTAGPTPFQYVGGPWNDHRLYPPELLRPFQAVQRNNNLSLEDEPQAYRSSDTIRVHRIDCQMVLRPDFSVPILDRWQLAPAIQGFPEGAHTFKPGKIMFIWIEYLDWRNLAPVYRSTPSTGSAQTSAIGRLQDGDLPSMWIPSYYNLFRNYRRQSQYLMPLPRDHTAWPATMVRRDMLTDEDWDQQIWDSPITGENDFDNLGQDQELQANVRFKVHKVVRYVHKNTAISNTAVERPPVLNNLNAAVVSQQFNSIPMSDALPYDELDPYYQISRQYVYPGSMGPRIKNVMLDLSLHFGNDGEVVEYWRQPTSLTGAAEHSKFGLAKKDLRLICVSNRGSAYWGFDQQVPSLMTQLYWEGQGMTSSISFRG